MKKLVIIPILALNLLAKTGENRDDKEALIAEYKDMFSRISQKRVGVDESLIDRLDSPFLKVEKKEVVKIEDSSSDKKGFVEPFALQAIFGNRAKISGKWYKLNDNVNGMKVVSINGTHVWLKNSEFRKKLTIGSKNEKISIK